MHAAFLKPSDPLLREIAEEVPKNQVDSNGIRKIIQTMLDIAYGQQKDKNKPVMVGLAAPQIGILKRIILVDVKADGKGPLRPRLSSTQARSEASKAGDLRVSFPKENSLLTKLKVYINPEIIWTSKRNGEWYEGCYSTDRICGIVSRPTSIVIKALKLHSRSVNSNPLLECRFKEIKEKHTGYVARIFQHEINHLDGKLFMDYIKNPDHLHWVEEKEFPLYRNGQAWKNWPKKASLPLASKP